MDKLISKIINLYKLDGSVKYISKVQKGYATNNYIIGDFKCRFFLKEYADGCKRVEKRHVAKKFFAQKGVPVILPMVNIRAKTYFSFNQKCYALFPYVEGRQFRRLELNKRALVSSGEMLANIHLATKDRKPKINLSVRNYAWDRKDCLERLDRIKRFILSKKFKSSWDNAALKFINLKKDIVNNNNTDVEDFNLGRTHIIHGDYHESNIFFLKTVKLNMFLIGKV